MTEDVRNYLVIITKRVIPKFCCYQLVIYKKGYSMHDLPTYMCTGEESTNYCVNTKIEIGIALDFTTRKSKKIGQSETKRLLASAHVCLL